MALAAFERQTGRVPTIFQLAVNLSLNAEEIRRVMRTFLSDEKSEGSSAFKANLLEVLLGEQMWTSSPTSPYFVNHKNYLSVPSVRLIDETGAQLGIVSTEEALLLARERGLDLFIVQPDANPPVARIMDYHRFKFEQEKRLRETKRKHHIIEVKEIKMRYQIADSDYQLKVRQAEKFLQDGDKVKVLLILRGRESRKSELAIQLAERFAEDLRNSATVDRQPKLEGKSVIMLLAPF